MLEIGQMVSVETHEVLYTVYELKAPAFEDCYEQYIEEMCVHDHEEMMPPERPPRRAFSMLMYPEGVLGEKGIRKGLAEPRLRMTLPVHETSTILVLIVDHVPEMDLSSFLQKEHTLEWFPPHYMMDPGQVVFSADRMNLVSSLFTQICDAVAICHDTEHYHGEVTPKNLLVHNERRLDGERNATGGVSVKLKGFYAFARTFSNKETRFPHEADIWSLGILLVRL
ncbi:hypothetical protein BV25DRAFT_366841 [Artomyces pyxidatus]|uniref:Uncharacterized protein n=1 Tax=Artomyces pyxidatus TaxID=48021 RepID=A0ACB8T5M6_9AGAM|nr:hypothetical protein BV25DRAFT_366841 [Artomyces pyxidatus]